MAQVILPYLRIILFLISFVIKNFKKVFIGYFAISYIIVYSIIIISDVLDQVGNSIKLGIVKHWSK